MTLGIINTVITAVNLHFTPSRYMHSPQMRFAFVGDIIPTLICIRIYSVTPACLAKASMCSVM